MKKIFLILALLFLSPVIVYAGSDFYEEAYIQDNGDILVKEAIRLDGTYSGFELNILYKYFDENKIYSADSFELVRVCESPAVGERLKSYTNCFKKVNSASNGDALVYTYKSDNKSSTIRMYNPSNRSYSSFYVEYILKNAVVKHNDIAELKLNVLSPEFSEDISTFDMKVYLPGKDSNMRIWGHGPLYGNSDIQNDDTASFDAFGLPAATMVDIRIAFDKDLVPNSTKLSNKTMFNKIIDEETKLADKANQKRERAEQWENMKYVLLFGLSGLWLIGLIIIWIHVYRKFDKEYRSDFNEKYFRDFPSDYSPEIVEYLMTKYIKSTGLSSSLLNIIRKKGLLVTETKKESGVIFKKEEKDYILTKSDELKEPLTEEEVMLRNWFLEYYGDGISFEVSSLKEKVNDLDKAQAFMKKYNEWEGKVKKKAVSEELFEESMSKRMPFIIYGAIPLILVWFGFLPALILFLPSFIYVMYAWTLYKRTKKGNDQYARWNALKNFLNDFGNFSDKELPEIHLWEKYLVYAHVFKIADKLIKQMEIKIQNVPNADVTLNTFNYLYLNHMINQSISHSVSTAFTNVNSRIASSSHSSGGGFGGGWSGGGGFSGGGGSGGGRF